MVNDVNHLHFLYFKKIYLLILRLLLLILYFKHVILERNVEIVSSIFWTGRAFRLPFDFSIAFYDSWLSDLGWMLGYTFVWWDSRLEDSTVVFNARNNLLLFSKNLNLSGLLLTIDLTITLFLFIIFLFDFCFLFLIAISLFFDLDLQKLGLIEIREAIDIPNIYNTLVFYKEEFDAFVRHLDDDGHVHEDHQLN